MGYDYKETYYTISYAMWKYDEDDDACTDGPYENGLIRVKTEEEAQPYIDKFKAEHPNAKNVELKFSEDDPDEPLIHETLICAFADKIICDRVYQFCVVKVESNIG